MTDRIWWVASAWESLVNGSDCGVSVKAINRYACGMFMDWDCEEISLCDSGKCADARVHVVKEVRNPGVTALRADSRNCEQVIVHRSAP